MVISTMKNKGTISQLLLIALLSSCNSRPQKTSYYASKRDSLNGNYEEIALIEGSPVSLRCFANHKLVAKGTFKNGQLNDLMSTDSLGNVIEHLPVLEWTNPNELEKIDTLIFRIKNVDSLSHYQFYYTTNSLQIELEEDSILNKSAIKINDEPFIKIPAKELLGAQTLFTQCGILADTSKSKVTTETDSTITTQQVHHWRYFKSKFSLK